MAANPVPANGGDAKPAKTVIEFAAETRTIEIPFRFESLPLR
jgi:hypothetical protein